MARLLHRGAHMPDSVESKVGSPAVTLGGVSPILRVTNLDASIAYYVDRLGFRILWRTPGFASVKRDDAALMLSEGDQGNPGTWLWISTSDVDVLYAELAGRGALLRFPPTNYPWDTRECQISDPDGHVLRFGSDLKAGEPMGAWLDGEGRKWTPTSNGGWSRVE